MLARLACKKAKPNGHFYINNENTMSCLSNCSVSDLPGVGWKLSKKLKNINVLVCGDLLQFSKSQLMNDFGNKTGETLYNFARGIDLRQLKIIQQRKSIGVDVNWGVRFTHNQHALDFIVNLSNELSTRLKSNKAKGKLLVLKV